jgi:kumamolisin
VSRQSAHTAAPWVRRLATSGLALALAAVGLACSHPSPPRGADLGPVSGSQPLTLMVRVAGGGSERATAQLAARPLPVDLRTYAARFGPDAATEAQLVRTLAANGLQATTDPGDWWVVVHGPAAPVERLFNVRVDNYRAPAPGASAAALSESFYAATTSPSLPAALTGLADTVSPITDYARMRPMSVPAGGLTPTNLLAAYDVAPLRQRGFDGAGRPVVFLETEPYSPSDLDTFASTYGLPAFNVQNHAVINPPPQKSEGESTMDLELVHEIAPSSPLVVYTVGGNTNSDAAALDDLYQGATRMVDDNPGAIISISLGLCESAFGNTADAWNQLFTKAAQMGETVFASTGDSGAYACLDFNDTGPTRDAIGVQIPSTLLGVTAVGGTRLNVRQDGSYLSEQVWEFPANTQGTGGGLSAVFTRPSWQDAPGVPSALSNGMREVPDVSADADPSTGAADFDGGQADQGGGTSQSAPIWAGITAVINQYLVANSRAPVGFFNPTLYLLARSQPTLPPFHDVTVGTNMIYPATPGYDMATGIGSPDAWNLAQDLAIVIPSAVSP